MQGFIGADVLVLDIKVFLNGQQLVVVGEGIAGLLGKLIENGNELRALVLDVNEFVEWGGLGMQVLWANTQQGDECYDPKVSQRGQNLRLLSGD